MMFLHILGADIPHHNRTLLTFFADKLAPKLSEKPTFFVVGNEAFQDSFPELNITLFNTKKALAKALMRSAKNVEIRFFFHGQYNGWLWLAILFGRLPLERCIWHIWGADLYETSTALTFKLFYPIRRLAQKRLKKVCGTVGDLYIFSKINPKSDRLLLYFPTKLPLLLPEVKKEVSHNLTILLGNSGDPSNQHLQGLIALKKVSEILNIIVPMGYPVGNQYYIEQVEQQANNLFPQGVVQILREHSPFEQYIEKIAECDLGYFPFERQQGIGTICLFLLMNIPFALSRKNPFCEDLVAQHIPFLYLDEISYANILKTKKELQNLDKSTVAFLAPNYEKAWEKLLCN